MDVTIAVYLRVSSALQADRNGTAAQREVVGRWLVANGLAWEAVEVFEDLAVSGKSMKRPGWERMMEEVRAGRIGTVVMGDLTRAGRTVRGLVEWLDEMLERKARVIFVQDGIDVDTMTGRLIFTVLAAVAEFVRKLQNEKIREGHAARRATGKPHGGEHVNPRKRGCAKLSAAEWRGLASAYAETGVVPELRGLSPRYVGMKLRRLARGSL